MRLFREDRRFPHYWKCSENHIFPAKNRHLADVAYRVAGFHVRVFSATILRRLFVDVLFLSVHVRVVSATTPRLVCVSQRLRSVHFRVFVDKTQPKETQKTCVKFTRGCFDFTCKSRVVNSHVVVFTSRVNHVW